MPEIFAIGFVFLLSVSKHLKIRIFLMLCLSFLPFGTFAQSVDPISEILVARDLASQGNYQKAYKIASGALDSLILQYGEGHLYHAYVLDDLSRYSVSLGNAQRARVYSDTAIDILESLPDRKESDHLNFLHNKASAMSALGNVVDSTRLFEQILAGRIALDDEVGELSALQELARTRIDARSFNEALDYLHRAQTLSNEYFGENSNKSIDLQILLSRALLFSERESDAEKIIQPLLARADSFEITRQNELRLMAARVAIKQSHLFAAEKLLLQVDVSYVEGSDIDIRIMAAMNYLLGSIALLKSDAILAAERFSRAIEYYSAQAGSSHSSVLRGLHGLALANKQMGKSELASDILSNVIVNFEKAYGENSIVVAESLTEQTLVLIDANNPEAAMNAASRAMNIYNQSSEATDYQRALAGAALGFALHASGQLDKSVKSFDVALEAIRVLRGEFSPDLIPGYLKMSEINISSNRISVAKKYLSKAEQILNIQNNRTPEKYGQLRYLQIRIALSEDNCAAAIGYGVDGIEAISDYVSGYVGTVSRGSALRADRIAVEGIVLQLNRCLLNKQLSEVQHQKLLEVLFKGIQLPQLQTTTSAISHLRIQDKLVDHSVSQLSVTRKRMFNELSELNRQIENTLRRVGAGDSLSSLSIRRNEVVDHIKKLDERIQSEHPKYFQLVTPQAVDVKEVQNLLGAREAMLTFLLSDNGAVAMLLNKTTTMTYTSSITMSKMAEMVESIRSGLDFESFISNSDFPRFDVISAYKIYQELIEPFSEMLNNIDHLTIVADGSLQRLPFALLLEQPATKSPEKMSEFSDLEFLTKRYSLSYLPSINSFSVLRELTAHKNQRSGRFLGFGDPIFPDISGNEDSEEIRGQPEVALSPELLFTRLPDSATELLDISELFASDRVEILLAENATKERVLAADYSDVSVLAFATHGIMADELSAFREPGLLFSGSVGKRDYGDMLLTSSDIANMKMDVGWVLLSACNTAAPQSAELGAEGLSGLARSFFLAGARSLLVSHWYVESSSASELTTQTLRSYFAEGELSVSRSQALQSTMNDFIAGEYGRDKAHPAFWAPFVVVGDA